MPPLLLRKEGSPRSADGERHPVFFSCRYPLAGLCYDRNMLSKFDLGPFCSLTEPPYGHARCLSAFTHATRPGLPSYPSTARLPRGVPELQNRKWKTADNKIKNSQTFVEATTSDSHHIPAVALATTQSAGKLQLPNAALSSDGGCDQSNCKTLGNKW